MHTMMERERGIERAREREGERNRASERESDTFRSSSWSYFDLNEINWWFSEHIARLNYYNDFHWKHQQNQRTKSLLETVAAEAKGILDPPLKIYA